MTLRLSDAVGPAGRRRFEHVPEVLHRDAPQFVPPFPGSVAKFLRADCAFARKHGEIHPVIAERDGRVVGRIAAIVNRTHNAHWNDRVGFFGFFECENDPATAVALFDRAREILRAAGCDAIRGPYSPSLNDECGLLTDGFERAPFIGLTWNPPYYADLVAAAGLQPVRRLLGLDLPLARLEMPARLSRLADHVARRSRLRLRPIDLRRLADDLAVIRVVYNDTLSRNWGFVPISLDDLLEASGDLRAIADPEMILIAEKDGRPAGVALSLPNFNELLAALRRTPRWFRLLRLFWLMKTRRIRTARQIIYGVMPEFRDRGLHAWLLHEQFRCARERFESAQLGWIEENNAEILESARLVGGVPARTWTLYEVAL